MMDKRAAKIRKMTDEVSKVAVGRFVTLPVQKKPAQKKTAVSYRRGKTRRMDNLGMNDLDAIPVTDKVNVNTIQAAVTAAAEQKAAEDDAARKAAEDAEQIDAEIKRNWDAIAVTGNKSSVSTNSNEIPDWIKQYDIEKEKEEKKRQAEEEAKKTPIEKLKIDVIRFDRSNQIDDWTTGFPETQDNEDRPSNDENRPPVVEYVKNTNGDYVPKSEMPKSAWDRTKDIMHDRYTKAGGVSGIVRSAFDVAKEGVHHSDADVSSMTSDQKDEIARTFGGYNGKTDAEITTSLRQIDNTIAQYNTAISKKKEEFSQADITVREKGNAAYKAKLERDRAQREYSNLLSSWSRMKPGPEKDQLESTITTKADDLLKAETEYNEKDEERVREERNKARIQNELDDIGRRITNSAEKKKELVNDKNLLLTALYRGLANKKKDEIGLYKKFKREMSERGKTMTGMGNMLSDKGVEWNDKLLAKPGSGAADGVSRIVGRNVGYHPSRSVTDVVVGSTNNNRNRALVDSLTTINAGRSVTPLGAPGSVHDGIGRQIQPTVRAGQVQMPQLSAPRLAGRPGQGPGKLTVTMPDVRPFGLPQQPAPQPSQPPVQQPVTAEMPKMGDFGKESITTFRKANNQIRFVFGDRKSNKGKRKHK
jgi:hypothetical protein